MKRLIIFAHFDKNNIIDDYVVVYLEKLKEVSDDIIFVSDGEIKHKELKKINHLILDSVCQKHNEYDFGSYKRGFFLLKEKYPQKFNELDEVIFANDSCYCIGDFKDVFKKMNLSNSDFWGLTQNKDNFPEHIQSYFVVFKSKVIKSNEFLSFISNIKKEDCKSKIIENYEIALTTILVKQGYKKSSFIEKVYDNNPMVSEKFFKEIAPTKFPLLKIELLRDNPMNLNVLEEKIKAITTQKDFLVAKNHINRVYKFSSRKKIRLIFLSKKIFLIKLTKSKKLLIKILCIPIFKARLFMKF